MSKEYHPNCCEICGSSGLQCFRFPKNQKQFDIWANFAGLDDARRKSKKKFLLCVQHFKKSDVYETLYNTRLRWGTVPSLLPPKDSKNKDPAGNYNYESAGIYNEDPAGIYNEDPAGIYNEDPAGIYNEDPAGIYNEDPLKLLNAKELQKCSGGMKSASLLDNSNNPTTSLLDVKSKSALPLDTTSENTSPLDDNRSTTTSDPNNNKNTSDSVIAEGLGYDMKRHTNFKCSFVQSNYKLTVGSKVHDILLTDIRKPTELKQPVFPVKPFACYHCGMSFLNKEFLKKHIKKVHLEYLGCKERFSYSVPQNLKENPIFNIKVVVDGVKYFHCPHCFFSETSIQKYKCHLKLHRKWDRTCRICGYRTRKQKHLRLHIKHTHKQRVCKYCTYSTLNAASMYNHHSVKHMNKALKCTKDGCSFKTLSIASYNAHLIQCHKTCYNLEHGHPMPLHKLSN